MAVARMKRAQPTYLHGQAKHRRTQSDYMAALLDKVTLETWGEVIDATVTRAKDGDAQARAWLAQYLMGKPKGDAPTPLQVVVQQVSGSDALVAALAAPAIDQAVMPFRHEDDDEKDAIRAAVADELAQRIQP